MVSFPYRGVSSILKWLILAMVFLPLVVAGPKCPFPEPGCKMSYLSTFSLSSLPFFSPQPNPGRLLRASPFLLLPSLWWTLVCSWFGSPGWPRLLPKIKTPTTSLKTPSATLSLTQSAHPTTSWMPSSVSKRSSAVCVMIFLCLLSRFRTLCPACHVGCCFSWWSPFGCFLCQLPAAVRAQMVARNLQTIAPAITDAATHAQAPAALACPSADPMQLCHLDKSEEARAPKPVAAAGVASATRQLLNTIMQLIATPVRAQVAARPQADAPLTASSPPNGLLCLLASQMCPPCFNALWTTFCRITSVTLCVCTWMTS